MSDDNYKVDVLVFGPHPDDAEIATGGLLLTLHAAGRTSAIVDMTEGESASHGTVEERYAEAEAAREILGVSYRENLRLPDAGVEDNRETRIKAAEMIRKYRPTVVVSPFYRAEPPGRGRNHADHYHTGQVVSNAFNYAHLGNLPMRGQPWQATAIYFYMLPPDVRPTFVVDFSEHLPRYLDAIRAHRTQFGWMDEEEVFRNNRGMSPFEMFSLSEGARYTGGGHAQGFYAPEPLVIPDVVGLVEQQKTFAQRVDEMRKAHIAKLAAGDGAAAAGR